jgi:hypothetical protein
MEYRSRGIAVHTWGDRVVEVEYRGIPVGYDSDPCAKKKPQRQRPAAGNN